MNYNADIPFERKEKLGSFEVPKDESPLPNKFKGAISLQFLENKTRDELEDKFRKIDKKRMKKLMDKDLPKAIEMINKMNDPTNIVQRTKLILPEPQVTETDLEGISKLSSNNINLNLYNKQKNDFNATRVLMGEYSQREMTPLSMIRTPKLEDNILKEAKIAANLREGNTPLIGGENASNDLQNYLNYRKTDLIKNDKNKNFKTPVPITPNILSSSLRNNNIIQSEQHSSQNQTKLTEKTPLRDEMRINLNEDMSWENQSSVNTSQLANKIKQPKDIKHLLGNLPKPLNNYDIDILDVIEEKSKLNQEEAQVEIIDDAEEKEQRLKSRRSSSRDNR